MNFHPENPKHYRRCDLRKYNPPFIVRADKTEEFLNRKTHTASDAIARIEQRRNRCKN